MREKFLAWLKIARLPFYPMTWVAYSLGAVAAPMSSSKIDLRVYLLGYGLLFFLELATILINEIYDLETDRLNKNYGFFTGGSRILVEGKLGIPEVKAGIWISLILVALFGYSLIHNYGPSSFFAVILILLGIILGLGYTAPPFKLSYRGLAEITVGLTHSPYVILCGYVFQGGAWDDSLPWLLSLPLFFATLGAITLAGIPDRLADREISKKVIAVLMGPKPAALLAIFFVCAANLSGILLWYFSIIKGIPATLLLLTIPHAILLLFSLIELIRSANFDRKIDRIMGLALSYITWFGLLPLLSFLGG